MYTAFGLNWGEERVPATAFAAYVYDRQSVTGGDESMIKTVITIRNAIAHSGAYAKREFERTVISSRALLRGERTPAGFLRTDANPVQKRFET